MPILDFSPDEVLATTRSVRKRLDLSRPVDPGVIRECLELAIQAPSGANSQGWHFVVVTDPEPRQALGAIYRKGLATYVERSASGHPLLNYAEYSPEQVARLMRVRDSAWHLAEHMQEVPVLIVPCIRCRGRADGLSTVEQAGLWGSIMPAIWSFMLAARVRGLGTCWTSVHLYYEQEAAEVLGIPYEQVTQAALIPVAYTLGTDFKPAARKPLESVLHWDSW
jgi:nitroreductase